LWACFLLNWLALPPSLAFTPFVTLVIYNYHFGIRLIMSLLYIGEKKKIEREESIRQSQNQAAARNAYLHPDPRDLQHGNASSGLPWGGVSIKHVVERGKEREQQSARRSREGGVAYDSCGGGDRGGGVSYYSSERGGKDGICQTESLRKEDAELLDPLNARGGPV
jgi:hypothetical protein